MVVGDVAGDGRPEIVLNSGQVIRLSRNGQALTSQLVWNYPAGDSGVHIALADIDGDGLPELIAESDGGSSDRVRSRHPYREVADQLGDLDALSLADVNGDGVPDRGRRDPRVSAAINAHAGGDRCSTSRDDPFHRRFRGRGRWRFHVSA